MLQLGELGNLQVTGLEGFHFVQSGRPHSGLIEGAVIRKGMLLATRQQKSTHTEKQGRGPHSSIVSGPRAGGIWCACVNTGRRNRWVLTSLERLQLQWH